MTKHYYALSDIFTGDNPKAFTGGFSNTKEPIAFTSRRARDAWVLTTRLLTARPISRREAVSRAQRNPVPWVDGKAIRVYGTGGEGTCQWVRV